MGQLHDSVRNTGGGTEPICFVTEGEEDQNSRDHCNIILTASLKKKKIQGRAYYSFTSLLAVSLGKRVSMIYYVLMIYLNKIRWQGKASGDYEKYQYFKASSNSIKSIIRTFTPFRANPSADKHPFTSLYVSV